MKKTNNFKRFIILFLLIAFICSFITILMQSCGGEETGGGTDTPETSDNAADEPVATEEDTTTTEPPTEPPTTTEKPPLKTEEILKWTFSAEDTVFVAGNQIENFRVEDGILKLTSVGGDPFMYTINKNLDITAADVNLIKIRVKNLTEGYNNQLFFITNDDTGWDEPKSIRGDYWYSEGEDWEELVYYTEDCDLWEGIIKEIRFDPTTVEGDIEIEYFIFEKIVN